MKNTENKNEYAQGLITFLNGAPTAFHAVAQLEEMLKEQGFVALSEHDAWTLQCGGRYYVTRNQSSLLAFTLPSDTQAAFGYRVVAAHTDSPAFKLKDICDRPAEGYCKLNVEKYGGMLCSSWMDRPLSIAGRAYVSTEHGVAMRRVDFEKPMAIIPNVAIHMDRNANDGKSYNAQVDMLPLLGLKNENSGFKKQLADEIGVQEEQILSHDLYLYVKQSGYVWGKENELLSAPRLDDLACVYGAVVAFLQGLEKQGTSIRILAAFDNEEVGSQTLQGAASSFLEDTVERIEYFLGNGAKSAEAMHARLANSLMLSADNAHAVHPNHPEFADAQNRPVIGNGVVLKFNAQQRYATDAVGAALLRAITERAGLKLQSYANRSDIPGGSTLGNIASTRIPLRTIDIGLPQLAMHSAFETMGVSDLADYVVACEAFFGARVQVTAEGGYEFEL